MRARLPLFAPANRRKARTAAPKPFMPEPARTTIANPTPQPRPAGPLATNTPYNRAATLEPLRQLSAAWLAAETERLDDLAALGGDQLAHKTIHAATRTKETR